MRYRTASASCWLGGWVPLLGNGSATCDRSALPFRGGGSEQQLWPSHKSHSRGVDARRGRTALLPWRRSCDGNLRCRGGFHAQSQQRYALRQRTFLPLTYSGVPSSQPECAPSWEKSFAHSQMPKCRMQQQMAFHASHGRRWRTTSLLDHGITRFAAGRSSKTVRQYLRLPSRMTAPSSARHGRAMAQKCIQEAATRQQRSGISRRAKRLRSLRMISPSKTSFGSRR